MTRSLKKSLSAADSAVFLGQFVGVAPGMHKLIDENSVLTKHYLNSWNVMAADCTHDATDTRSFPH